MSKKKQQGRKKDFYQCKSSENVKQEPNPRQPEPVPLRQEPNPNPNPQQPEPIPLRQEPNTNPRQPEPIPLRQDPNTNPNPQQPEPIPLRPQPNPNLNPSRQEPQNASSQEPSTITSRKIAIVYHGLSSGKSDEKGVLTFYEEAFASMKKFVIDVNPAWQVDIFFHTWKNSEENAIISTLAPLRYMFESKKDIDDFMIRDVSSCDMNAGEMMVCSPQWKAYSIFSRNYSLKRSIQLVTPTIHEYTYLLCLRFDMVLLANIPLELLKPGRVYVNEWGLAQTAPGPKHLDGAYIEEKYINKVLSLGFPDYMFIFSPADAIVYSTIYDCLPTYLDRDSEYEKTVIDREGRLGWPVKLSGHPICYWHMENTGLISRIGYIGRCDLDVVLARNHDIDHMNAKHFVEQGQWLEAISCFEKCKGFMKDFNVHLELCVVYTKLGKVDEAYHHAKISNDIHPNPNAQNNMRTIQNFLLEKIRERTLN
jgi:hypothetical protein